MIQNPAEPAHQVITALTTEALRALVRLPSSETSVTLRIVLHTAAQRPGYMRFVAIQATARANGMQYVLSGPEGQAAETYTAQRLVLARLARIFRDGPDFVRLNPVDRARLN